MKLLELVRSGLRKKVVVDGIEVYFKKLTFNELEEVQAKIQEIQKKYQNKEEGEEGEEDNEDLDLSSHLSPNIEALSYLFEKYITDKDGNKIVEKEEIPELPVIFANELLEKFLQVSQGIDIDDPVDIKKK